MIGTEEQAREKAKIVVTDEQFSLLLRDITDKNKSYLEHKPLKGMFAEMVVITKHKIQEEFCAIPFVLVNFPPPPNSLLDKYDELELLGAKYYDEEVQKKKSGKKCYPLAVFLTCEAWSRIFKDDEEIKNRKESLAEYEDKQEVLITTGMTIDGRENGSTMSITRDKNENVFLSEPRYADYEPGEKTGLKNDLTKAFYLGFIKAMPNIDKRYEDNR